MCPGCENTEAWRGEKGNLGTCYPLWLKIPTLSPILRRLLVLVTALRVWVDRGVCGQEGSGCSSAPLLSQASPAPGCVTVLLRLLAAPGLCISRATWLWGDVSPRLHISGVAPAAAGGTGEHWEVVAGKTPLGPVFQASSSPRH